MNAKKKNITNYFKSFKNLINSRVNSAMDFIAGSLLTFVGSCVLVAVLLNPRVTSLEAQSIETGQQIEQIHEKVSSFEADIKDIKKMIQENKESNERTYEMVQQLYLKLIP